MSPSVRRPFAIALAVAGLLATGPARGAGIVSWPLSSNAGHDQMVAYFNGLLQSAYPGNSVASLTGAGFSTSYDADGHIVGPSLLSKYGGYFYNSGSDRITLMLNQPVRQISFDFEIFPNGSVPDGRRVNESHYPDFTFKADGVTYLHQLSAMPNGASRVSNPEYAPQYLSTTQTFTFGGAGVTTLEFIDWPVRIGVSNLRFDRADPPVTTAAVPEPSLVALAAGLGGLATAYRLRRSRG
jgi:hypothetical protein